MSVYSARSYWLGLLLVGLVSCTSHSTARPALVPAKKTFHQGSHGQDPTITKAPDNTDSEQKNARPATAKTRAASRDSAARRTKKPPAEQASSAAPAQQPSETAPGNTSYDEIAQAVLLDRIFFAHNGVKLEDAAAQLEAVAALAMQSDSDTLVLLITGHADSNELSPVTLSLERATVVHDFLLHHGVPGQRLKVEAHGDALPCSKDVAQTGSNQRVEIRVLRR